MRRRGSKKKRSAASSQARQKLGRSRGGLCSKIHAAVDAQGRLLHAVLTPGQASDAALGPRMFAAAVRRGARAVAGDKAYDSDAIRDLLSMAEVEAVVPNKANRKSPADFDAEKYRGRNVVERFFRRMKEWRKLAFRSEKRACAFMGFFWLFASMDWLRHPTNAHTP